MLKVHLSIKLKLCQLEPAKISFSECLSQREGIKIHMLLLKLIKKVLFITVNHQENLKYMTTGCVMHITFRWLNTVFDTSVLFTFSSKIVQIAQTFLNKMITVLMPCLFLCSTCVCAELR